ncbi:hypothetical protein GCM10023082_50370 [Streptomyces tremellae]|uniref:Uncharacterized protein n=1 Tax=Streptomyces tremellae TaxID=1124239 RepID=A0ABP7FTJ2_9ACTN
MTGCPPARGEAAPSGGIPGADLRGADTTGYLPEEPGQRRTADGQLQRGGCLGVGSEFRFGPHVGG